MNCDQMKERIKKNAKIMYTTDDPALCAILIGENRAYQEVIGSFEALENEYKSLSELHKQAVKGLREELAK